MAERAAERLRAGLRTAPGRYRLWSVVAALLLALATLVATTSATRLRASTQRARTNSGPVLVATQQLVSSLAEADAAATAAFLSGKDEDPEQRRLYEQALARASQQVERISTLAGDDPITHAVLGDISVQITRYAGLVEAARASNKGGVPEATRYLVDAVGLADGIVQGNVSRLTGITQDRLNRDVDRRTGGFAAAVAVLLGALGALVAAQVWMTRASRRIVNPPLALGSILVLVALSWLALATRGSGRDLGRARHDGYDSISLTARLETAAFGAKADETLALITTDSSRRAAADDEARRLAPSLVNPSTGSDLESDLERLASVGPASLGGGLITDLLVGADTPREKAAVQEMARRWQRYRLTVGRLRAAPPAAAKEIAVGAASSDFNGFNFSAAAVLGQNRDQFLTGLRAASDRTGRVPWVALLLPLGALVAVLGGFQLRINEYR